MEIKQTKAPHFDAQKGNEMGEMIILAGDQAWKIYNKGEGEQWKLLCEGMQCAYTEKPVILDKQQLAEVHTLLIAPKTQKMIRIIQCGNLTEMQKALICQNLASKTEATTVAIYSSEMALLENSSNYIARCREDAAQQEQNAKLAKLNQAQSENEADKVTPYIDYQDNGVQRGLFYFIPKVDKEGFVYRTEEKWICDKLELKGEGFSNGGESFYIFEWQHPESKQPIKDAVSWADFGTADGWKQLKKQGLRMSPYPNLAQHLASHFHFEGDHETKWTVTETTGWNNNAYLLPSGEILGNPDKPVIFRNRNAGANGYTASGSVAEWQENIARYVNKNSSMMLAVAASFAAPLLTILKADSFGVHLYNDSTKGKTTSLNVANSIWGETDKLRRSWNSTPTAIMNYAQSQNDGLLALDEIGQCDKYSDVENIAYQLFNETGRGRGQKEGGNREIANWKVLAVSTGEDNLEGILQMKGIEIKAGQLVRLLNIPMSEAAHFHGFSTPKQHADHLNEKCKAFYGSVGREWIAFLMGNAEKVQAEYKRLNQIWQERLPNHAHGQVQRVASRFAILETALQLASHLTQWTEEDNREAIIKAFNDWLAEFGTKSREETKIIQQVNGWILANCETRFVEYPFNPEQRAVANKAGYRMLETKDNPKEFYFVYPAAFDEATEGKSKRVAIRALADAKMLKNDGEAKSPYLHRIFSKIDKNRPRCFILYPLDESADDETLEK